jgi:hypothetical protein
MAQNDEYTIDITIADSATTSSALEIPHGYYLAAISKDNTLDTSTAITFTVSVDGGTTYRVLNDTAGSAISYTVVAATAGAMTLPPTIFYPYKYIKCVVADAQTGITTLQCVLRQY